MIDYWPTLCRISRLENGNRQQKCANKKPVDFHIKLSDIFVSDAMKMYQVFLLKKLYFFDCDI